MNIDVFMLAWNEAKILPFVLTHYSSFATRIFVLNNESTDDTVSICKKYPKVQVLENRNTGGLDDVLFANIKSNIYKQVSRNAANIDWSIMVDTDELLYHPNILEVLSRYKKEGVTLPKIQGYNMASETFPDFTQDASLPLLVPTGVKEENYSKRCILDPKFDMAYGVGAHPQTSPIPADAVESKETELKLLHYKQISLDYVLGRYNSLSGRLSENNKARGFGFHYNYEVSRITKEFNEILDKVEIVV